MARIELLQTTTGWLAVVEDGKYRRSAQFPNFADACSWALNIMNDGGVRITFEYTNV